MNVSYYIARRYLFSKKKHSAINIISLIAVFGVTLATLAMVCTLSVFNGFQDMVATFFTAFDPELKITVNDGKVFDPLEQRVQQVKQMKEIEVWCETLEENAMIQYRERQTMAVIKGVQSNFESLNRLDSVLYGVPHSLPEGNFEFCLPGGGLISELGAAVDFSDPLEVYAPKRTTNINLANPSTAFVKDYLLGIGTVFITHQEKYDSRYMITSLPFARRLFNYSTEVSSIELKLKPGTNLNSAKRAMKQLLGSRFNVQDRYEQQADVFKIMEIEKLISYIFLTFILAIASFNIIGSLSMLIIDKREDVQTLRNLGANDQTVTRVFAIEGRLISVIGAVTGIVLGLLACYLQQTFGLIKLGTADHFIVQAYPVSVHALDVLLVFATVIAVGFLAVQYPVSYLSKRLLNQANPT